MCLNSLAVLLIEFWLAFLFGLVVVAASDSGTVFFFFITDMTFKVVNTSEKSSLPIPFQPPSGCSLQGFLFQFLAASEAESSHGYLQPFSGAMRGINQEGEEGREQLHNCHLRFLSLESHDLFSLTSAHLTALWPVYFYCQVSVFLSVAVSVSISSMMYYKQAVSSLIHTHTHTHTHQSSLATFRHPPPLVPKLNKRRPFYSSLRK